MGYRYQFKGRLSALSHPQYLRYWLGSFASVGATQLMVMGQGWLVYELSGSAMHLGYLGAAASIPTIVITLFGGALADRLDKRAVLMATSVLVGFLLLVLAILDYSETVAVWHVLVIAGLIALVSGFDWPTRQAIFPLLIDQREMMSAVALNSIIWQSCRMIMPAFGGVIIAVSDTWLVFLLCAVGFFTMFIVVSGLKVTLTVNSKAIGSTLAQIREGLQFIAGNYVFAILIPLSFAGMLFGTSYMQLMPAFADLLQTDVTGYGYLISATGIGAVAGTILVGSLQHSHRLGVIMLISCATVPVLIYVFALVTAFATDLPGAYILALISAFTISMCSSVFMITSLTVLQLHVPDEIRGRVMGIHGITYSMIPLGGLLAGAIASVTSAPVAISVGGTIYLAIVLWVAVFRPEIRRIDGRGLSTRIG
jgi:MFS family permease